MEFGDVDDPAGEKQHYQPVVPTPRRTTQNPPEHSTLKADDAGRIKAGRADETSAGRRGTSNPSRPPKHGEPESVETDLDETDGPSGN